MESLDKTPPKETHEQFLRRAVRELENWLKVPETRPKRPAGGLDAPQINSPYDQELLRVFEKFSGESTLNETQQIRRKLKEYRSVLEDHLKIEDVRNLGILRTLKAIIDEQRQMLAKARGEHSGNLLYITDLASLLEQNEQEYKLRSDEFAARQQYAGRRPQLLKKSG